MSGQPVVEALRALLSDDIPGALEAIDRELDTPRSESASVRDLALRARWKNVLGGNDIAVDSLIDYASDPSDTSTILRARETLGAQVGKATCIMCHGTRVHPFHPANGETYWARCPACVGTGWES